LPNRPDNDLLFDDESWIELDPDGIPLGRWSWCNDEEEWVFDEFPPPLSAMPATGTSSMVTVYIIGLCISLLTFGVMCRLVTVRLYQVSKRRR